MAKSISKGAKDKVSKLQSLASTAAKKMLLDLPPLYLVVTSEAPMATYRLKIAGHTDTRVRRKTHP